MVPCAIFSYSEFRTHLSHYMDQVSEDRTELHVTRQGARAVVVLVEEEFASIIEALHLVRSPRNADRLTRAIDDADAGKLTDFDPTA